MDIKKAQHNSEHLTAASYVVNKSPWIFSTANMGIIFGSAKNYSIFFPHYIIIVLYSNLPSSKFHEFRQSVLRNKYWTRVR